MLQGSLGDVGDGMVKPLTDAWATSRGIHAIRIPPPSYLRHQQPQLPAIRNSTETLPPIAVALRVDHVLSDEPLPIAHMWTRPTRPSSTLVDLCYALPELSFHVQFTHPKAMLGDLV
jgi:hypothetical protein